MSDALGGTVVCTSGGTAEDKRAAKQLVESLGGRYSAELTQQCTHLVIKRGRTRESDKERCASICTYARQQVRCLCSSGPGHGM